MSIKVVDFFQLIDIAQDDCDNLFLVFCHVDQFD